VAVVQQYNRQVTHITHKQSTNIIQKHNSTIQKHNNKHYYSQHITIQPARTNTTKGNKETNKMNTLSQNCPIFKQSEILNQSRNFMDKGSIL
jgi:hypothetical protein